MKKDGLKVWFTLIVREIDIKSFLKIVINLLKLNICVFFFINS